MASVRSVVFNRAAPLLPNERRPGPPTIDADHRQAGTFQLVIEPRRQRPSLETHQRHVLAILRDERRQRQRIGRHLAAQQTVARLAMRGCGDPAPHKSTITASLVCFDTSNATYCCTATLPVRHDRPRRPMP